MTQKYWLPLTVSLNDKALYRARYQLRSDPHIRLVVYHDGLTSLFPHSFDYEMTDGESHEVIEIEREAKRAIQQEADQREARGL